MITAADVAPPSVRWTARRVDGRRVPRRWGELRADRLRLKDTRGAFWKNRLEAPNRFVYVFPTRATHPWEEDLLRAMRARVATRRPLRVELYATPGSRNESYGEWVVGDLRDTKRGNVSELTLYRLREQPPADEAAHEAAGEGARREGAPAPHRSRNEALHDALLRTIFPPADWTVVHEPETLLDLHEPTVVDGVARDVAGKLSRSYTCDFVVASRRGCARLCVESKACEEHVTAEALTKARLLRDRSFTRVVIMCGGAAPRWLDLGAPGGGGAEEAWYETHEALRAALGLP